MIALFLGYSRPCLGQTQPIDAAISVQPDRCWTGAELAASVAGWLSRREVDARLRIQVESDGESGQVRFKLRRQGQVVGERTFAELGENCEQSRRALSLAIAVAIDATLLERLGLLEPKPDAAVAPKAEPDAPARPEPEALSRQPSLPGSAGTPLEFAASAEAAALLRVLPTPAAAGALGFEVWRGALGARVSGGLSIPSETALGPGRARFSLLSVRLDGCASAWSSTARWRPYVCAGAAYGNVRARGSGYSPSYGVDETWAAIVLRLGSHVRMWGPMALMLALDGVVPLFRPDFHAVTEDGTIVATIPTPSVGAVLSAGAQVRW